MPRLVKYFNRKVVYAFSLVCGGIGFASMVIFHNPYMLFISMLGIGISWAGILAMPYAILSNSLPVNKMGTYMGIFNLTVVIPQIVIAVFSSIIVGKVFEGKAIMMVVAGVLMLIGSLTVSRINDKQS
jgi:maltose/moltooligosaccharide transporter